MEMTDERMVQVLCSMAAVAANDEEDALHRALYILGLRAAAAPEVGVALSRLAVQFDEMAEAAYEDGEFSRRDVWRCAADQARFRAREALSTANP